MTLTRRVTLRLAASAAAVLAVPAGVVRAVARTEAADAAGVIAAFCKGRTPVEGRIDLDLPFAADNANAVPVSVRVDSPMSKDSYCEEILLVAEKNPRPAACTFGFAPGAAVPHVATRIRLAETQTIAAVARMNDGAVFIARKTITVTIGGCGG